jgi:hypothetical protein
MIVPDFLDKEWDCLSFLGKWVKASSPEDVLSCSTAAQLRAKSEKARKGNEHLRMEPENLIKGSALSS